MQFKQYTIYIYRNDKMGGEKINSIAVYYKDYLCAIARDWLLRTVCKSVPV